MKNQTITLATPNLFSWDLILDYLNRDPNEVIYQINGKKIRRAFKIDNLKYLCEISQNDQTNQLDIRILNQQVWAEKSIETIKRFVMEWFELETSLEGFYELAENDPILSGVAQQFMGLRMVGIPDFYEAITWGILGQQINIGYAYTLKRRFTEKYGDSVVFENHTYWIYPEASTVGKLSIDELLELRLTLRKAEYLLTISQKIVDGQLSKVQLLENSNAQSAEKQLITLRGIGPWTANYVLMRCLRMGDAFPMADIGVLNGIQKLGKQEARPDKEQMNQFKERWGTWCSYATFYIWRKYY